MNTMPRKNTGNDAMCILRGMLTDIEVLAPGPAVARRSHQIETLCRGYMEQDLTPTCKIPALRMSRGKMFALLLKRRGQTVSRQALMDVCQHNPDKEPDIKIVDVHITHIRKAIKNYEYEIETIWGVGYRLKAAPKTNASINLDAAMAQALADSHDMLEPQRIAFVRDRISKIYEGTKCL